MADKKPTEIASLGEFGLIDRLTDSFSVRNASTLRGVGDDAAVIAATTRPSYCLLRAKPCSVRRTC